MYGVVWEGEAARPTPITIARTTESIEVEIAGKARLWVESFHDPVRPHAVSSTWSASISSRITIYGAAGCTCVARSFSISCGESNFRTARLDDRSAISTNNAAADG
jgi:hypothetical protein